MTTGALSELRLRRMHDVTPGTRHGEVHADVIGTKAIGQTVRIRWF